VITPFFDFLNNVWPLHTESIAWRYASEGLFSGSLLTIAIGMLLAGASALLRHDEVAARVLSVTGWLLAAGCVIAAIDFVLCAIQMRTATGQDPAALVAYDLGTWRVALKYVFTTGWFAWSGFACHRWLRGRRRKPGDAPPPQLIRNSA
jgi:hypothetical protein